MIEIRTARAADLPGILAIYNEVVQHSTATFDLEPQTVEERRAWFDAFDDRHPFLVAVDDDGTIAGYSYLSVFRGWPAYAGTAESSVYVHKDYQGRGLAERLMLELLGAAKTLGYHVIVAGISNDSLPSAALHRKLGFEKVGCFKEVGWKFGEWQDVCFYQLTLE
ncbi:MAG TPA: GNAT family N-acetyltransferase [Bacillales bacterium]|nr:GNAT family N-acetyltransferase [Bacillales bacterium]